MSSSAKEIFERVSRRAPPTLTPGDPVWKAWLSKEIGKEESLEFDLTIVNRERANEVKRHREALDKIQAKLAAIQTRCRHEMHRATAECEPQCRICGFVDSEYRRS
jgi:hypothetical protein